MKPRSHKYANHCKPYKMACGGKVVKRMSDGGKVKDKPKEDRPKADPEMLGSGAAQKAGTVLRDKRRKQMEELGLADGGYVSPPKKGIDKDLYSKQAERQKKMAGKEKKRISEKPR